METGKNKVRRRWALATAATIAGILAPGGTSAAAEADYFGVEQGCPATYKAPVISQYSTAKRPAYEAALNSGIFADISPAFQIIPPVDWNYAPNAGTASKLHQLKFLDRLFGIADDRRSGSVAPFTEAERTLAIDRAAQIAADWARAATAGSVPAGEAWKQRTTAIRLPYLAYAARRAACAGRLTDADATALRAVLARHAKVLSAAPPTTTPKNQRLTIVLGASLSGHYFPNDPVMVAPAAAAEDRFLAAAASGYDPVDGVWLEHSPRYHRHAYETMETWLEDVNPAAERVREIRDRLLSSLGRLLMPDNRLVTFGDTSGEPISDGAIVAARQTGFWVAPNAGYAVQSGPANWFGLTAQYHARQHKQADELSFDLFEGGQRLIQDTGFYGKDRNLTREYQSHARAHSTLTVGGRSFNWRIHKRPYGSGIQAWGEAGGWYAVQARNPLLLAPRRLTRAQKNRSKAHRKALKAKLARLAGRNIDHSRIYAYLPGELLVIADRARATGGAGPRARRGSTPKRFRATFQRRFQFAPAVGAQKVSDERVDFSVGGISGRALTSSSAPSTASVVSGRSSPLLGWAYPITGQALARPAVSWATRGRKSALDAVTVLAFNSSPVFGVSRVGRFEPNRIELRFQGADGGTVGGVTISRQDQTLTITPSA